MIKYQKKGGITGMKSSIKKLDELDKCIFAGKEITHYTEYKPNLTAKAGMKCMVKQ